MSFHKCKKCGVSMNYNGEYSHYYCPNRKCMIEDNLQKTSKETKDE